MNQDTQTITRLKDCNIFLGSKKFSTAYEILDRMTDDEIFTMFDKQAQELIKEGRLN